MTNDPDSKKISPHGEVRPLQRIDRLCDEFEGAWLAGEPNDLAPIIERIEPEFRSQLFRELLQLEIHYREIGKLPFEVGDFYNRFPEYSREISDIASDAAAADITEARDTDETAVFNGPLAPDESGRMGFTPTPSISGYELIDEVARGGMGIVFRAKQVQANRIVALKMILSGQLAGPTEVQRFVKEAKAAARLDHPNIVPVFEIGEQEGQHFFSMGFVEGQSLKQVLAKEEMEPRTAVALIRTLAEAIDYAHGKGIIHRDLKPANVMLDWDGNPKITDFGLSKSMDGNTELTGTGQLLGTPAYMSPEQAAGKNSDISPATDVYSLGAMLYEMLTRSVPFESETVIGLLEQICSLPPTSPRLLNSSLDEDLNTICMKCLEKAPEQRYRSARSLADDLERYLKGEPILARPVGRFQRTVRWCKRRRLLAGLSASLVASLLLFGSLTLYFASATKSERAKVEMVSQQSDENMTMAWAAVDQMVEQAKLLSDVPRREKQRLELLNQANEFYAAFVIQRPEDRELRYRAAMVHQSIGNVFRLLGEFEASSAALAQSIDMLGVLAKTEPATPRFSQQLAESYIGRGLLLKSRSIESAFESINQAVSVGSAFREKNKTLEATNHTVARALYHRGMMRSEAGEMSLAEADYEKAIDLLEELIQSANRSRASTPALQSEYVLDLGRTLNNYGNLIKSDGRKRESIELIRRAIRLHDGREPNRESRHDVAVFRNNLANALASDGEIEVALVENDLAVEILGELVEEFPQYGNLKSELANALNTRGAILGRKRDLTAAATFFTRAANQLSKLTVDYPEDFSFCNRLGNTKYNLAVIDFMNQQSTRCIEVVREAVDLHTDCWKADSDREDYGANLQKDYRLLVRSLRESGDGDAAQTAIMECREMFPSFKPEE